MKKFGRKTLIVLVAVLAAAAIVGGTFAWFVNSSTLSQKMSISGFTAEADVFFTDGNKKTGAEKFSDGEGIYRLSLDKNDINYIGNLRVKILHTGAKSCIRVRMNHEWINADGSVTGNVLSVPYKFGNDWYDNREMDYCMYYRGADNTGKADFDASVLVSGFNEKDFDCSQLDAGVTLKLALTVESVQVNRYPQFWQIDTLPWK